MTYEELQTQIMYRFWRCNEMTKKQAEDYAWIAVNEIKRCEPLICDVLLPLPNEALRGNFMPGMTAVRQSEEEAA